MRVWKNLLRASLRKHVIAPELFKKKKERKNI